ncbi:hypothetical protein CONLIGDRAFT_573248 [Coniochaeta ligniaria NRRL 30616]|uniref:FHA domain-containing protein n=1 Tax=Coniochaeta ligniaria NRRL 30616 TaxID=1408157 RepID=A0A1J7JMT8_9PEZI|nr:hypothetical protein CONLIGDRAFT_573248 [Coniochaeta ligniaria NRRL 30616]
MTAVANPPSFSNLSRPSWGVNGGQTINSMNAPHVRNDMLRRSNSASSIASTSSTSSTSTVSNAPQTNGNSLQGAGDPNNWSTPQPTRKRPQPKGPWPAGKPDGPPDFQRPPAGRPPMPNGMNGMPPMNQPSSILNPQGQIMSHQNAMPRPGTDGLAAGGQPVLYLLSLNGTFERKTISVPFYPDTLRIGRQTNAKTVPTPVNGFFDSKVLSRQHAEIWADRSGKIWIRDIKSSNGTFVNGARLSQENRESEPHELQSQDHLELGIDIVNEDQKTVVHHKVAAKVEHAGFVSPSNSILDMGFPELDPAGNGMMPLAGAPFRPRTGSQASVTGRMPPPAGGAVGAQANGPVHPRPFWLTPITTEHIVKRLHVRDEVATLLTLWDIANNEMRNARLQNQDLARTGQFISTLLSKEDIKNPDKPEAVEAPKAHVANGSNGLSFRSDGGKNRFSDPPAPPPSQPLPEKPDIARPHAEIPSLKRVATEKPKTHNRSTSPVRQENLSQVLQLTEALSNAKKEIDSHSARVRELEEMFQKEREARLMAEDLARKIEESNAAKANGSAEPEAAQPDLESELDKAFDLATERPSTPEPGMVAKEPEEPTSQSQPDPLEAATAIFQSQMDSMVSEMVGLREQLEAFRQRAEKAEAERDEDRKTLAEMVMQIRRRDEEDQQRAAQRKSRSPRRSRSRPASRGLEKKQDEKASVPNGAVGETSNEAPSADEDPEVPTLSRANTITPSNTELGKPSQDPALLMQGLPYASMIGVVLLGMGMMAYINGWQPHPRLDR